MRRLLRTRGTVGGRPLRPDADRPDSVTPQPTVWNSNLSNALGKVRPSATACGRIRARSQEQPVWLARPSSFQLQRFARTDDGLFVAADAMQHGARVITGVEQHGNLSGPRERSGVLEVLE